MPTQFGNCRAPRKTPTITAGAYGAGDVVGDKIEVGVIGSATHRGVLKNIGIVDRANQKAVLTILLFEGTLTGTYTDNGAPSPSTADLTKYLGKVEVAAADYTTINGKAYADIECAKVIGDGMTVFTAVVVCTATPTYVSTSDLTFTFGILGD